MAQLDETVQVWQDGDNSVTNVRDAKNIEIERLVTEAVHGEQGALEALCTAVAKGVLARVRFLQSGDDAEDIAQEALVQMCAQIHTLKEPKAFRAWLNKIIASEVRYYCRRNTLRGQLIYLDEAPQDIANEDEKYLPDEQALRKEEADIIMEIIETLPMRQREAVLWHYYDGMSITETAKLMGIAHQNVSQYLAQARRKVYKELTSRAKSKGSVRLNSIALLPMGVLIWQVIENAGGSIAVFDTIWVKAAVVNAIEKAASISAAKGAVAATVKTAGFAGKLAIGIATAALAVTTATVLLVNGAAQPAQHTHSVALDVDAEITFSVANPYNAALNPTGVSVWAQSENGEMQPQSWWITTVGSDETLYDGEDDSVDEVLAEMLERGENGEYMLIFFMEDEAGDVAWLRKQFIIQT